MITQVYDNDSKDPELQKIYRKPFDPVQQTIQQMSSCYKEPAYNIIDQIKYIKYRKAQIKFNCKNDIDYQEHTLMSVNNLLLQLRFELQELKNKCNDCCYVIMLDQQSENIEGIKLAKKYMDDLFDENI